MASEEPDPVENRPQCAALVRNRPCKFHAKQDSRYCGHHVKYELQQHRPPTCPKVTYESLLPQIRIIQHFLHAAFLRRLDTNFLLTRELLGDTTWKGIPSHEIICMRTDQHEWWHVPQLCLMINYQLNKILGNRPSIPVPSSPFTRLPYTVTSLQTLRQRLSSSLPNIVSGSNLITLQTFLSHCIKVTNAHRRQEIFEQTLRFQFTNETDSMGMFCGKWVLKDTSISTVEKLLGVLQYVPMEIFNNRTQAYEPNPHYDFLHTFIGSQ